MAVPNSEPVPPFLTPGSEQRLIDQIVAGFAARIEQGVLRAGARLPSIRQFAAEQGVSRFTVVEAYDRLVARGHIESRRGSGYFVLRAGAVASNRPHAWAEAPSGQLDVVWLLRNMFKRLPPDDMPGAGVLPADWLDADLINQCTRAIGRMSSAALLDYGHPQGYLPLREQLVTRLAQIEINAGASALMTSSGATQALDIVAQHFLRAGDTVLVDEPSWFVLFGRFSTLGVHVIGVPRQAHGHDPAQLESMMQAHQPRLMITTAAIHNPTGSSMSSASAFQLLRLAEKYDVTIVEDDVYSDLQLPGGPNGGVRLAALDGLNRVVYIGSFSKTLAASLRVGFVAGNEALIRELTDLKMLLALTTGELGERVVYRVLSEGHYRRHLNRLRERLTVARESVIQQLESMGLELFVEPAGGMFVWANLKCDTNVVARLMLEEQYLMAPGSLFMPDQRASTWMRFNVATSANPRMLQRLQDLLQKAG